jgi:hypothetical protein
MKSGGLIFPKHKFGSLKIMILSPRQPISMINLSWKNLSLFQASKKRGTKPFLLSVIKSEQNSTQQPYRATTKIRCFLTASVALITASFSPPPKGSLRHEVIQTCHDIQKVNQMSVYKNKTPWRVVTFAVLFQV